MKDINTEKQRLMDQLQQLMTEVKPNSSVKLTDEQVKLLVLSIKRILKNQLH